MWVISSQVGACANFGVELLMGGKFSRGQRLDGEETEELEHYLESTPLLNSAMMSSHGQQKLAKRAKVLILKLAT